MARKRVDAKILEEIDKINGVECHRIITPAGRSIECPYHDDVCPKVKQLRDEMMLIRNDMTREDAKNSDNIKKVAYGTILALIMGVAILGTKAFGLF